MKGKDIKNLIFWHPYLWKNTSENRFLGNFVRAYNFEVHDLLEIYTYIYKPHVGNVAYILRQSTLYFSSLTENNWHITLCEVEIYEVVIW